MNKPLKIMNIEIKLHMLIEELYKDLKNSHTGDGLNSPRDIELAKEINLKAAIMDKVQEAMRKINPDYEIRD